MVIATSNIENVRTEPKPYFSVRREAEGVRTDGLARCSLGRRIPVVGQEYDEGVFVEWEWNGRCLTVENDRYGLYPLFYCAKGDSICISPSLAQVVRSNSARRLDLPALGIFFRMGHFVGEDTPFDDVRFLPPNCALTWEDGRLELQVRSSGAAPSQTEALGFDEAVETYRELFAQSISRRLPGDDRFTVPVSGGRDSRHILLELARQGARPRSCATVKYRPPATNEDTRVARLLAARLGVTHVEIDKPSSFFQAELKEIHLTNYCGGGHGWILPLASRLNGEFTMTYDGLAGEVLSAGFMLSRRKMDLFRMHDFEALASLVLAENQLEPVLRNVLSAELYRSIPANEAIERLVRELRKHAEAANPVLSFVFWNRTRRCIGSIPFGIFHQIPVVHVPYLDHALFDFLFSLDPALVEHGRLHDETIRRSYPGFADIPYEDKSVHAKFSPADRSYYREARKELFTFLGGASSEALQVVNRPYLVAKIAVDLLARRVDAPWYLRPALQAIELERLRLAA